MTTVLSFQARGKSQSVFLGIRDNEGTEYPRLLIEYFNDFPSFYLCQNDQTAQYYLVSMIIEISDTENILFQTRHRLNYICYR